MVGRKQEVTVIIIIGIVIIVIIVVNVIIAVIIMANIILIGGGKCKTQLPWHLQDPSTHWTGTA